MSEEMQKDPLQEELDASLAKEAELEKENAALGAELSKKKEGMLDRLNARGLRFALSNVLEHEGKRNVILQDWLGRNRYRTHELFMDYHYSNYRKKSRAADSKEVLITNF